MKIISQPFQQSLYRPISGVQGLLTQQILGKGFEFKYEFLQIEKNTRSKSILFEPSFRLIFSIQGKSDIRIGKTNVQLEANSKQSGAIISVNSEEYGYKQLYVQKNRKELVIFLSSNWLKQNLFEPQYEEIKTILDSHLECFYFSITPMMQQILSRLCSPQLKTLNKLKQQSLFMMLISDTLEQINQHNKTVKAGEHLLSAIEKLGLLLQTSSCDDFSINDMANFCNSNPTTFQRVFKQHYGQSIGAYKRQQQLNRAQTALLSGTSIMRAAQVAGYTHMQSFSQAFQRQFGCLPKEIKN